jgi:quercetin dioxygenase-like cupin family protein
MSYKITSWQGDPPGEKELRNRMVVEGLEPYAWSNSPGDRYSAHRHGYAKVIYVVSGSIEFGLPELDISVELHVGDRLDLPAEMLHNAVVGSDGVKCLEGHR